MQFLSAKTRDNFLSCGLSFKTECPISRRPGIRESGGADTKITWIVPNEDLGRLLCDADTPDAVFEQDFRRRYGTEGDNLLQAYELASRTPLRLASLFNSTWDHTLYNEGMMWLNGPAMDYIGADDLIAHEVLDPGYVAVGDYVAATNAGRAFEADRITPPILASQLEADSREALRLVEDVGASRSTELMYEVADVRT